MKFETPFTAVLVGFEEKDGTPMDLLAIGSHDLDKYSMTKWKDVLGEDMTCPLSDSLKYGFNVQPAVILFLEDEQSRIDKINDLKIRAGLSDEEMHVAKVTFPGDNAGGGGSTTFDFSSITDDVHFLRLRMTQGRDYHFLKSVGTALEHVWYIDFIYDWKDDWESGNMKKLIDNTLSSFACYWHGANGNLFRITGCWQTHYDFKSWSKVVCVNAKLEGAKPIVEKMEEAFMKSVESGKSY